MHKPKIEIDTIKQNVLQNIAQFGFEIEKTDLGRTVYNLKREETEIKIDLIYASLNDRKEFFFGIEEGQFEAIYKTNRNFFQIFVCENENQIFIIPLSFMMEILKDAVATDHVERKQFKPIIRKRNGTFIMRITSNDMPKYYDLTDYFNRYDYLLVDDKQLKSFKNPVTSYETEIEIRTPEQKFKLLAEEGGLNKTSMHTATIQMLRAIGEWYGFKVLTETTPLKIPNFPYQIDCLWYKDNDLFLAIEVCYKGSIEKDKDALKLAKQHGARKVIMVTEVGKLDRIRKLYMYNGEIKSWTEVWSFDRIFNMYETGHKFFREFNKFKEYGWNDNIVEYI